MGTLKDRNDKKLSRRWRDQEMGRIHGKTAQKDFDELDKYEHVVNHPEPDILECKVKWVF